MKITLCGSIAFYEEMLKVKADLEKMGNEVKLPPIEIPDENGVMITVKKFYELRKSATVDEKWVWQRKGEAITSHFEKIVWSDAILVLNYEKNGIQGYVGGNVLMEIGLAFFLKKKIYFLNEIPTLSYTEELLGMNPIVLNGDISKLNG